MKRYLKNFIKIMILAVFVLPIVDVFAASTIKIERKSYIQTGSRQEAKFYTNKGYAYCITPDRIGAKQGATLTYMSKETKGDVLYLLNQAGTSDHDYLVTQLAIWIEKFNYMPDYYVQNSDIEVVKSAKSLAAEAAKNKEFTIGVSDISFSADNTTLQLTNDGKYYKSGVVRVGPVGGAVKSHKVDLVGAPAGAEIKEVVTGAKDNTYRFEIWVPATNVTTKTTFKATLTAVLTSKSVERYTPGDGHQDLVILVPEEKTVNKDLTFTVNPVVRKCEVFNNQYYGKDGNVVSKEVYESQCLHKCQKVDGKYFDKDGKETTEDNYKLQCFTHTCEKVGDKYFGKDGLEVNETDYTKQCLHICEIYNNEYYDSKGYKVSQDEYKKQCEVKEVVVPDTKTGTMQSIIMIVFGSIFLGTVVGYLEYSHKKVHNLK